jgi:uncharacterized protein YqeY
MPEGSYLYREFETTNRFRFNRIHEGQDAPRTSVLRMVKAALMNREIEKGGELTDEETTKSLQSLVKQRRDSIEQYEKPDATS